MFASVLSVLALAAAQPAGAAAPKTPPKAAPAAKQLTFEPKTKVDGESLQVIHGQRAVFRVGNKGWPVIATVEDGQLAAAHATGAVTEKFEPPGKGLVAAALDGSPEKRASFLKIWNGTAEPLEYRGMALVMLKDSRLRPMPMVGCPIPPGAVRVEAFPAPIAAVSLARFKTASKEALARPGCK